MHVHLARETRAGAVQIFQPPGPLRAEMLMMLAMVVAMEDVVVVQLIIIISISEMAWKHKIIALLDLCKCSVRVKISAGAQQALGWW